MPKITTTERAITEEKALEAIYRHFVAGFRAKAARRAGGRRLGLELKFPLVRTDGSAGKAGDTRKLWAHLKRAGWQPVTDALTGEVVGARRAGEQNDTVAACETGYCKTEFSLAHTADLFKLRADLTVLLTTLDDFSRHEKLLFLGYGIQPVTPPSKHLLCRKSRTSVWESFFPSNRHIAPEDGDDMHLFTVAAAVHVHVDVSEAEAATAVNVLNGFAGAQLALTAHSNIWRGRLDRRYKCVSEKFWDWWLPDSGRVGLPPRPYRDLTDYVAGIAALKPVYVERDGKPLVITGHDSFLDYYRRARTEGRDARGRPVTVAPEPADFDVHNTCYWFTARVSRYHTVESRLNDQQPPRDLLAVPALILGLAENLDEGREALAARRWADLRTERETACRYGLGENPGGVEPAASAGAMLEIARRGLARRGRGEEIFLAPFYRRLVAKRCPADQAAELYRAGGIPALLEARRVRATDC